MRFRKYYLGLETYSLPLDSKEDKGFLEHPYEYLIESKMKGEFSAKYIWEECGVDNNKIRELGWRIATFIVIYYIGRKFLQEMNEHPEYCI